MSDISSHNDSSMFRDVEAEYELLRSQNKELSERNEVLNQEVHILRSRAQAAERTQLDYQSEVECHQQQISEMKDSHAASLTRLKEDHSKIVGGLESRILYLETELSEILAKSAVDKEELSKIRKELVNFQDQSEVAGLKAELQEVLEEHAANHLACVQHQELNKVLLKEKSDLIMELNSTREHLETIEEKLKICKSDLTEQTETIEELRESLAIAQSELSCLKAGPTDLESRGNSLFAEVEDKRQAMVQRYSTVQKKYSEMKKDYGAKCDEISRLKLENLRLRRQWQEEADERDNRDVWLKDNYEIRIKELLQMVEDVKKDEKPVFLTGDSKILSYVDREIEKSRKDVAMLREEMERRSSNRLDEAKALYLARSELLTAKSELMTLRAENIILREKLKEANITDIPSPGKTIKRLNEVLLSSNAGDGYSHVKDNAPTYNQDSISAVDVSSSEPITSIPPQVLPPLCSAPKPVQVKIEVSENSTKPNQESIAFEDVPSSNPAILSSEPQVSFLCPPKPKCLLKLELMEKLQSEDACQAIADVKTENSSEEHQSQESSDHVDFQQESSASHNLQNDHKFSSPSFSKPSHVTSSKSEVGARSPVISLTEACASDENAIHIHNSSEYESAATQSLQSEKCGENLLGLAPRRSILSKLSRPSLIPIDQNSMSRKVRFAEEASPSCDEPQSKESDSNLETASKKRLSRMPPPKPFKTKIVVSRETIYQQE